MVAACTLPQEGLRVEEGSMASRKFQRKIEEVAAQVMEDGEQFVAGVAGQAGAGAVAKVGGWTKGAEVARAGAYLTGDMFNALGILTDRNVYLVSTPPLKAYEVKEVVSKSPIGSAEVAWAGRSRLEIGDYYMTCTYRMRGEAQRFAELASQTGA
jgi:hypothetical protein